MRLLPSPPCCWPPCPRRLHPERRRREPTTGDDPHASRSAPPTDACELSATEAPAGKLTFDVTNDGSQGHRVLPARRGRPADRRRGREHRPRPRPASSSSTPPAGTYVTACKPGMKGDGIRADFTVTDSGEDGRGQRRRAAAGRRRRPRTYAAYVQDQSDQLLAQTDGSSSTAYKAGDDAPARALYPRRPHALGADRDRRGVLRRPRPEDGRPRGRPRARPEVDRLAPHREGPVAGPRGGATPPLTAAGARDVRRRPARRTPRPSTSRVADARPHRRPDRQRLARACSRRSRPARSPARRSTGRAPTCGTSRPTSTARRWLRGASSRSLRAEGPRARRARSTPASARCRSCSTRSAWATASVLRPADPGARSSSWPTR